MTLRSTDERTTLSRRACHRVPLKQVSDSHFLGWIRSARLVGICLPLLIFGALAAAVAAGVSVPGDRAIYRLLSRTRDVYVLGDVAGSLASRAIEVVGAAGTAVMFLTLAARGRVRAAAFLAASLVAPLLTPILKGAFDRQPPGVHPLLTGGSFPSGHAIGSMAFAAVAVIFGWPTRWRMLLLGVAGLFVAAIGVSAVVAGDHWPSDVIAGWSLALVWVGALYWLATALRAPARGAADR